MGEPKPLEPSAFDGQAPVHGVNILHRLRRPESFSDSGGARPDPRVNVLRSHVFRPHGGLTAQDASFLLRSQTGSGALQRINHVVLGGGVHQVDVISIRKNSHITLARRDRKGFLATPRLHHNIFWYAWMQHLIPPNGFLSMLFHEGLNARAEIGLQVVITFHAVLTHISLDARVVVPLLSVYFIAA